MQKSIYFTLSIPLFDRFSTRNQVKTARLEENNARLSLENEKRSLYKDIEKAYMDALAAFEKYESTNQSGSCQSGGASVCVREVYGWKVGCI